MDFVVILFADFKEYLVIFYFMYDFRCVIMNIAAILLGFAAFVHAKPQGLRESPPEPVSNTFISKY